MSESKTEQQTRTDAAVLPLTTVVLPARNESNGIRVAVDTIGAILDQCSPNWEIVVIDDGSEDDTFDVLRALAAEDVRVRAYRFSRNFGKEAAILAGLHHARGERVITMDADLQHPPDLIPDMIREWSGGARVVNAVKRSRAGDSLLTRVRAEAFNYLISRLGGVDLRNASDFKLLDRRVVDQIIMQFPERRRFYRGLTDWIGHRSVALPFDVDERVGGESRWSILKLAELALTALVSFTSAPLRIVTLLGLATLVLGFFVGVETLISWARGEAVSGFATVVITLLLIGSSVMISLGIMGEYIAKIYDEVKRRPAYLIEASTDDSED